VPTGEEIDQEALNKEIAEAILNGDPGLPRRGAIYSKASEAHKRPKSCEGSMHTFCVAALPPQVAGVPCVLGWRLHRMTCCE